MSYTQTKIGITGSRKGMTPKQKESFVTLLHNFDVVKEVHHGDCKGVDENVHDLLISSALNLEQQPGLYIHPPKDDKYRAYCSKKENGPDVLIHNYKTEEYLVRNRAIVNLTEILIAFPDGLEKQRSGTWATIRYAIDRGVKVIIVQPDGELKTQ